MCNSGDGTERKKGYGNASRKSIWEREVTNSSFAKAIAAAMRAAAAELERSAAEESTPTRSRLPTRAPEEVDELAKKRADAALRRLGILRPT